MSEIVIISGSPTELSRSEQVLKYLGKLLEGGHLSVTHLSVRELSYQDLFTGNYQSPEIRQIAETIEEAKGVIVGSPVYKGDRKSTRLNSSHVAISCAVLCLEKL